MEHPQDKLVVITYVIIDINSCLAAACSLLSLFHFLEVNKKQKPQPFMLSINQKVHRILTQGKKTYCLLNAATDDSIHKKLNNPLQREIITRFKDYTIWKLSYLFSYKS